MELHMACDRLTNLSKNVLQCEVYSLRADVELPGELAGVKLKIFMSENMVGSGFYEIRHAEVIKGEHETSRTKTGADFVALLVKNAGFAHLRGGDNTLEVIFNSNHLGNAIASTIGLEGL